MVNKEDQNANNQPNLIYSKRLLTSSSLPIKSSSDSSPSLPLPNSLDNLERTLIPSNNKSLMTTIKNPSSSNLNPKLPPHRHHLPPSNQNQIDSLSHHHSHSTVTHFDLDSLIEQNNLTDDSCLVAIDGKAYDLTIWLQDQLSSSSSIQSQLIEPTSPPPSPLTSQSLSSSSYHHSHFSNQAPSTSVSRSSQSSSNSVKELSSPPSSNQLNTLLRRCKTDPVKAGNLLRSIFEQNPSAFGQESNRIEDWIQEYRIGDYNNEPIIQSTPNHLHPSNHPTKSKTNHPKFQLPAYPYTPFTNLNRPAELPFGFGCYINPNLAQPTFTNSSEKNIEQEGFNSSFNQSTQSSTCSRQPNTSIQSTSLGNPSSSEPSSHLARAMSIVSKLKQQVHDAERGVGMANLSLREATAQLEEAERVRDHLIFQASEGFRPIWHGWNN
uniref:Uncharacterized protein n=1 Tax=Austropuccinia psidii MF-1 TaxID=1389203 RepID=A0A9Q3D918_9BASI|nr:hypothetical protein [Austropuccinia psidii MF-1]